TMRLRRRTRGQQTRRAKHRKELPTAHLALHAGDAIRTVSPPTREIATPCTARPREREPLGVSAGSFTVREDQRCQQFRAHILYRRRPSLGGHSVTPKWPPRRFLPGIAVGRSRPIATICGPSSNGRLTLAWTSSTRLEAISRSTARRWRRETSPHRQ